MEDINLFIESLESLSVITFHKQLEHDGLKFRFYTGPSGARVIIDYDEESFTGTIGIGYLRQLGLSDVIPFWFPDTKIEKVAIARQNGVTDLNCCSICNGIGVMQCGYELIPCEDCNGTGMSPKEFFLNN